MAAVEGRLSAEDVLCCGSLYSSAVAASQMCRHGVHHSGSSPLRVVAHGMHSIPCLLQPLQQLWHAINVPVMFDL